MKKMSHTCKMREFFGRALPPQTEYHLPYSSISRGEAAKLFAIRYALLCVKRVIMARNILL